MVFIRKISPDIRAYAKLLISDRNKTLREVAKICNISPASVLRIKRDAFKNCLKKRNHNIRVGRPRKLNIRDERRLIRGIHKLRREHGNFSIRDLMKESGISEHVVSVRTVGRYLNNMGYRYLQARKKGLLRDSDLKGRLLLAKK